MITKFRKTMVLGFVFTLITAPALSAEGSSKEETVGVSMGVVIGGVAGGPVGASSRSCFRCEIWRRISSA